MKNDFIDAANEEITDTKFHLETVKMELVEHEQNRFNEDMGIKDTVWRRRLFELRVEKRFLIKNISAKEAALTEFKKRF